MSHTLFIGQTRIRLQSADSTNTWLRNYITVHPEAPEGLVVTADLQFAGRGQQGRAWVAEEGMNLTASILLRPRFMASSGLFYLNKAIALAVCDTLAGYVTDVRIKWPNDIYVQGKKVAGILIETAVSSSVQWVIAGIGINANQQDFGPEAPQAASISGITDDEVNLELLLNNLCHHIEQNYLLLRAGQTNAIEQRYHENLLQLDQPIHYIHNGHPTSGIVKGVDPEGRLMVLHRDKLERYAVGEIQWLVGER